MVSYARISLYEREEISRQIAQGISIRKIAGNLTRSPSTISREINRSVVDKKYYRAIFAQQRWNIARHKTRKNRKLIKNPRLRRIVIQYLSRNWSPEQIAKRLVLLYPNDMDMYISHETIYSYLYVLPRGTFKKRLIGHLRRHHTNRRTKGKKRRRPGFTDEFFSIEERPQEAADRTVPGHWEGDLIVGSRNASAIGSLVERTTRMVFLVSLKNQEARTVRSSFAEEFRHLPEGLKKTLTYDQGVEMVQHKLFTKETSITVYFAHPHSPWERGTNENTNALIRQYFPKGTDFSRISVNKLKHVQDELNNRPRKTLGWHTPHEQFSELLR